ncbi:MAG TPA: hypothetical protein PKG54_03355 [Phycisphaerae bacterium]|jgi:hypothetical protein|nr:hypothetical protein [Phycisphaerae bacterium]HOB73542.1 hypothetical protein [Phycisphaerae bacterium]HOJ54150.1 hypothetical protein [Phycisphaerae bacterium]HOL25557.1 hypothetical protein [Phycisphaerae bacterium]HPP21010.1 hypothetical protein [Phycisphaerae bacterium]
MGPFLLTGCAKPPPPYVLLHQEPPKLAHCFDGIPHIKQSKPWVLGGQCCCTPTDELMAKYHADGVCTDLDTAGLIDLYRQKGITLAIDHKDCNGLCENGPHVVKGGRCMAPPTPGTREYEEIVTGAILAGVPSDAKQ